MGEQDVHIIGAGISGLRCAELLTKNGIDVVLHECTNRVGGRMKTDEVDGFLLDHGFHVMQAGYPLAGKLVNHSAMESRKFKSGARVLCKTGNRTRITTYADPFRRPFSSMKALFRERWGDLLRVMKLRSITCRGDPYRGFTGSDDSTLDFLTEYGFSERFIQRFFGPLFAGIFLESELRTSERMFRFIFASMSRGAMVLPARGIRAYPEMIAERVGHENILLESEAEAIRDTLLVVDGNEVSAAQVVITHPQDVGGKGRSVWTVHLAADVSPVPGRYVVLNGDYAIGRSLIAHMAIPSDVQPTYAPDGKSLIAVTIVGDAADALGLQDSEGIEQQARKELLEWFPESEAWQTLGIRETKHALPERGHGSGLTQTGTGSSEPIVACGDHVAHGSVEGALISAELAAKEVIKRLSQKSC